MMRVSYSRECEKSFMRIQDELAIWEEFEIQMMLHYQMDGLLSFYDVTENGEKIYCYEITGMQSLDMVLQRKELTFEFLQQIFTSIQKAVKGMREYLLSRDGLILKEEMVFVSNDGKQIAFAYLPRENADLNQELITWMEYILTKIKHSDLRATQMAYTAYQNMLDGVFCLSDTLVEDMGEKEDGQACISTEQKEIQETKQRKSIGRSFFKRKAQKADVEPVSYENVQHPSQTPVVCEPIGTVMPDPCVHPTVYLGREFQEETGWLLYQGVGEEQDIFIDEEDVVVGKQEEAVDYVLHSDSVSRIHARISQNEKLYYIEDMNSTNGTFVNEQRIPYREQVQIKKGDRVAFGSVRYIFY